MSSKLEVKLVESILPLVTGSTYETGGGFNLKPGRHQRSSADFATLPEAQRAASWE
jgi:hypothetical protein